MIFLSLSPLAMNFVLAKLPSPNYDDYVLPGPISTGHVNISNATINQEIKLFPRQIGLQFSSWFVAKDVTAFTTQMVVEHTFVDLVNNKKQICNDCSSSLSRVLLLENRHFQLVDHTS
jgi:hypothetical protein